MDIAAAFLSAISDTFQANTRSRRGCPLRRDQFVGGDTTVRWWLEDLGFEVRVLGPTPEGGVDEGS